MSSVTPFCDQTNGVITASVTGGTPIYNYVWNTVTSTTETLNNISAGSYTLIVTDNYNCEDTLVINLKCRHELLIPELFSPNGDSKNDNFIIKAIEYYPHNVLQVFNRWGSLVYSKKNYNNEWDGKSNASDTGGKALLPAGTYYVVLDFGDGETKPYHGYVQLEY